MTSDAEHVRGARRIALDADIAVDEDRADVIRGDQVRQVVGDLAGLPAFDSVGAPPTAAARRRGGSASCPQERTLCNNRSPSSGFPATSA